MSENQFKNLKTLKIIELTDIYYNTYYPIKDITFETIKKNENNIFSKI